MGAKIALYSSDIEKKVKSAIGDLPKKPKGLSLEALIRSMKAEIEAAKKAGYSLDDIAKVITDNGAAIKANTLKQYLSEKKPEADGSEGETVGTVSGGGDENPEADGSDQKANATTEDNQTNAKGSK